MVKKKKKRENQIKAIITLIFDFQGFRSIYFSRVLQHVYTFIYVYTSNILKCWLLPTTGSVSRYCCSCFTLNSSFLQRWLMHHHFHFLIKENLLFVFASILQFSHVFPLFANFPMLSATRQHISLLPIESNQECSA